MSKVITCIGAGYVGVPTMVVCAEHCHEYRFICVDQNADLIRQWLSDACPIYEPHLEEVLHKVRGRNLFFETDIDDAIRVADIIFIAVCTPTKTCGLGAGQACDLSYLEAVAKRIRDVSTTYKVIVEKSTVPVGTGSHLQTILNHNKHGITYDVISNPEFLAEGTAIDDLEHPHRVLIGAQTPVSERASDLEPASASALQEVVDIYRHWVPDEQIVTTDRWSSELSKLVANSFLAQRISSINSISMLCEQTGGHIDQVSKIIGKDSRIGSQFINSSVGFGGSCFQKDLLDLIYLCEYHHLPEVAQYWRDVLVINELQKRRFVERVLKVVYGSLKGRHLAVFGFSFKKDTGDTRESPSITICQRLLDEGAILHIYDPKVTESRIRADLGQSQQIIYAMDPYTACTGADALLILTAWDVFKTYDYRRIREVMEDPAYLFDGCHFSELQKFGFVTYSLGSGP